MTEPNDQTTPEPAAPFTFGWRLAHATAGDRALELAAAFISPKVGVGGLNALELAAIGALSDLAAAHYTAANVRARPAPSAAEQAGLEMAQRWLGIA